MELKMLDMDKIVRSKGGEQSRQSFDAEKLDELAQSIQEADLLQPILVRPMKDGKFKIVCGERRYRAFERLKAKRIPVLIREFKDDIDAFEKNLIENLQRDDLSSVERENAISRLWESGRYKNQRELAKKLGKDESTIGSILIAKDDRKTLGTRVSTTTLTETSGLSVKPRKKLLEAIEEDRIPARDVREVVRKIKQFPEQRQQIAVLDEFEEQETQSREIFEGIVEKQRRIAQQEIEPEVSRARDADEIRLEAIKDVHNRLTGISSSYVKMIKHPKCRNEAVQYLKKMVIYLNTVLVSLDEIKVVEHAKK